MTEGRTAELIEEFAERLQSVRQRIDVACERAGRDSSEITLIVVSKYHPVSTIRVLESLGVHDFGENRHQEAQQKANELTDLDINWHFIGQLQTKKARQAARYASVIHSIDRTSLVDALATSERTIDAFVQVNLTADPGRGGVSPDNLEKLTQHVLETPTLQLRGVMAMAPVDEEPKVAFERLAEYSARVQKIAPAASEISAGMTHDFEEAIQFGATHLRIGTAITGNRP